MKKALALMAVVLAVGMTAAFDAEAKRLGGGRSSGMQRQSVTAPHNAPPATPGNAAPQSPGQAAPAAGTAAAAAGTAAAPKRNWMGPIAGIAAGLGLAALASHFGFGEALANMLTIGLIVMAVLLVVGMIMRKRAASQQPAAAGMGNLGSFRTATNEPQTPPQPQAYGGSMIGSRIGANLGGAAAVPAVAAIPADFDVGGFVRNARAQFIALQAANDAGDFDRLREYLSPEMFEVVREEVRSRGDVLQRTEVFGLDAQVLEVVEEGDRYIVSVRFTGSVREQPGATPEDLDEVWHLAKPRTGPGGWVIAGIQQTGAN